MVAVAVADQKTHVLMVSAALQGHPNPTLKFAKSLISKGIHVTIAITGVARDCMLKNTAITGVARDCMLKNTATPSIQLEFFSDGLDLHFDGHSDYDQWLESLSTKGRENLSNLITKLSQHTKFSCLVLHQLVPWFIPLAAHHGIPCAAVLWIQPCALYSIYYRFFNKLNPFLCFHSPDQTLQLPGLPLLHFEDLPSLFLPNTPRCFTNILSVFFKAIRDVKWVLGTSFEELEGAVVASMAGLHPTIHPVGPFLLEREKDEYGGVSVELWKADDSCLRWLDGQEMGSVVYVSFGSIIVLSQKQIENVAEGLKRSGKPFLWVLKEKESGGGGLGELPSGFLEDVDGRGLVVSWCSQEQVLKHEAVGCFLTHCGWNSTLETIVAGVPVIAFPEWTDQPTIAKFLTDVFKVGVRMRKGDDGVVSSEEVERCIREMTDGPAAEAMAKKAAELKEAAKRAVEDGGTSNRNLDMFIADIAGKEIKGLTSKEDHGNGGSF